MSWYSVGVEEAERMAASSQTRRTRKFFTKPGESATVRFLTPASLSFNYKRAFVRHARGEKFLTSPGTVPDPFVEAGLSLQATFAWPIIDRRILEFKDSSTGEDKKIGPRVLYFADGQRTRKQLLAFEKDMLASENEDRAENNLEPLTLEEFNITSYDLKVSKEKDAPWNFVAKRPKELTKVDIELIEKAELVIEEFKPWLMKELEPLPEAEIRALLSGSGTTVQTNGNEEKTEKTEYSYDSEEDDTISFDE